MQIGKYMLYFLSKVGYSLWKKRRKLCKDPTYLDWSGLNKKKNLFESKQAHITYEAKPRGGHFMLLVRIVLLVAIGT